MSFVLNIMLLNGFQLLLSISMKGFDKTKKKKIEIKGMFYAFFKKLNLIINFILFPNTKGINRLHYFNANVASCKHVLELYWARK